MFRRGTRTEDRAPSEGAGTYGGEKMREERTVGQNPSPYGGEMRQEAPVAAPPRGNGHAVREGVRMVGREEMVELGPRTGWQYLTNWFTALVGGGLVLAETALGLRLFFKLFTADNTNWFVKFIYHISGQLIRPFNDVIPIHTIAGGGILEPAVVIGLVLFAIASVLAIWVVRSLGSTRSVLGRLIPM